MLDRLDALRSKHGHVLDVLIMDILQMLTRLVCSVVSCPRLNNGIIYRGKTLDLAFSSWATGDKTADEDDDWQAVGRKKGAIKEKQERRPRR